ncbi:hypothetical protein [Methylobacterium sp. yr596]|uniref:hypothetical protein n=1 Tax=Methylobacterium sp. yr596 TaxID=1761800 RepID=UPI0008DF3950|nr:hypothetical protein [Methylobacterium sp. yr596]SFF89096.1 hypothetical protein SAMN04487844_1692 [Methylobacterium sp. yr596]
MATSPVPVDQLALAPVYRLDELRQRKIVRIIQPISSLGITAAVEAATAAVQGALDLKADRTDLIGKAAAGANSDITSLSGLATALSVGQGGTGAKTPSGARAALGLGNVDNTSDATKALPGNPIGDAIGGKAAKGANADITSLSGLTTPLSQMQGGTGATDAPAARVALGLPLVPSDPGFNDLMEALWLAWANSLPVWSGSGPAPVPSGKPFLQGPGGPVVIAQ